MEEDKGFAVVTFDLPGSRANTMGQAVLTELEALAGKLARRADLRGLLFRSSKPGMFIAGADLRELGGRHGDAGAGAGHREERT